MHSLVLVVSLALVAYALVSKRAEKGGLTPPIVFLGLGLLLSWLPMGLDGIEIHAEGVQLLAELTLILLLFSDASRINLTALRRETALPVRLLAIGMPLTIGLGLVAALVLLPELSLWEAGIVAAVLTPTDAALGQAVVSHPSVPLRIRQSLNVESGLNDGIALPLVLIFAALATGGGERTSVEWLQYWALQLTLGVAVGAFVGWAGGRLTVAVCNRDWVSESFSKLVGLGLALCAYAFAEAVGGNGFISAFVGGLVLGHVGRQVAEPLQEFLETEGQLLTLMVFFLLGASMVWPAIDAATWPMVLYALVSLTLVRMLPVAVSMFGASLRPITIGFLGWFGPRGLASVIFVLLVVEEHALAHEETIVTVVCLTVLASVVLHGVTAPPAARSYAKRMAEAPKHCEAEMQPVAHHRLRINS